MFLGLILLIQCIKCKQCLANIDTVILLFKYYQIFGGK